MYDCYLNMQITNSSKNLNSTLHTTQYLAHYWAGQLEKCTLLCISPHTKASVGPGVA